MPVADVGFLGLREAASFVSGLRVMSTAFPISIESLTGLRYASIRSKVDVPVELAWVFVFVLLDVLVFVLMNPETGGTC